MKKFISALISVILIFTMAFAMVGCKKGDDGVSKIGIAMPTKSLERWNRDGTFLKDEFEKKGYTVELKYSDNNVDQQVSDIENLIADDVDVLIIAAIDGESLTKVLDTAAEKEIPVISYDRLIMNTEAVSYYVSFDNYTVGKLQGEYVVDALGLDLSDTSTTYNIAGFFFNGAFDVLSPYIDAGILNVVSGQTDFEQVATASWSTETAMTRMQNILASYYSDGTVLDVALCSNDSTALGVTNAIASDYAGTNTVIITGQDGDEANLANIVDGLQSMTVFKAVANEAVVTVAIAELLIQGKTPDAALADTFDCECAYDTSSYDNGTGTIPSYLLVPSVVTVDNIEEELVTPGYYVWSGEYPVAAG